jgi:hypothetical protein
MRVRYQSKGENQAGGIRNLTIMGAFIITDKAQDLGDLKLILDDDSENLHLSGEVVDSTADGFAVAFHPHSIGTLKHLGRILGVNVPGLPPLKTTAEPQVDHHTLQGEEWTPPATETLSPQVRPSQDFVQPGDDKIQNSEVNFPTILKQNQLTNTAPIVSEPEPANIDIEKNKPDIVPDHSRAQPINEHVFDPLEIDNLEIKIVASEPTTVEPITEDSLEIEPVATEPIAMDSAVEKGKEDDRRRSTRHSLSIPIEFDNLTGLIKEFTHNISYGGMFVYSNTGLANESQTAVTLIHPVHGQRLTLQAKVVHSNQAPTPDPSTGKPRYGLGLEFVLPIDELKRILADFIGSHQKPADHPTAQIVADAKTMLASPSGHNLFGVKADAPNSKVRQAYFSLVDQYHPDRYFGKINVTDRKVLEDLFRHLTKAYEKLTE